MKMQVTNVKPQIGTSITIDKAALLDDDVIARCQDLLDERGVLVFPRIGLTDKEQLAFTDKIGTRVNFVYRVQAGGEGMDPDVYRVTLDPKINPRPEIVQGTFFWHMDGLNSDIPPPKASLLSCRNRAPKGGQTEFASTYAAYKYLPEADKAEIAGLNVVHSLTSSMRVVTDRPAEADYANWTYAPDRTHPLVWTHKSGRKSLIVGYTADKVVDQPVADGRALLARLLEWTAQPDFVYRHEWQVGDFVVWDNCGVVHRVIPYDAQSGRMMHRTSIAGLEKP